MATAKLMSLVKICKANILQDLMRLSMKLKKASSISRLPTPTRTWTPENLSNLNTKTETSKKKRAVKSSRAILS